MRRQRKVPKRKATRWSGTLRFAAGNLRCLPKTGSSSNSPSAQTIARPDPFSAALLGPARRVGETGAGTSTKSGFVPQARLAGPSSADGGGVKGGSCLRPKASSDAPRRNRAAQVAHSEAQGPGQSGRLFLCLLSFWRRKKKVSCCRATPGLQANHQYQKRRELQQTQPERGGERLPTWIPDQVRDDKCAERLCYQFNSCLRPWNGGCSPKIPRIKSRSCYPAPPPSYSAN